MRNSTTKAPSVSKAKLAVWALAATGLGNDDIAAQLGRPLKRIESQVADFYPCAQWHLPHDAFWDVPHDHHAMRTEFPRLFQRLARVMGLGGQVQLETTVEVFGYLKPSLKRTPLAEMVRHYVEMLVDQEVDHASRVLEGFLDDTTSAEIREALVNLNEGEQHAAALTLGDAIERLGGLSPGWPLDWPVHAVNQGIYHGGFVVSDRTQDLHGILTRATRIGHGITRRAACIALAASGSGEYAREAAEIVSHRHHRLASFAYCMAYKGDQHLAPGVYQDLKVDDAERTYAWLLSQATMRPQTHYLRPLALAQLAIHTEQRPGILHRHPELRSEVLELERLEDVHPQEQPSVTLLLDLAVKSA